MTEPPEPVAVPVYVVVAVGETFLVLDATGVTKPIPLLILNVLAFVVVHESVEEFPVCIIVGFAVNVQVGAGGGGGSAVTVTVVEQVTEPPAPVAVPVYVLVEVGETEREPLATGVTAPTL